MRWWVTIVVLWVWGVVPVQAQEPTRVSIERVTYRGWKDAVRLSNGTVEVVVVPQLARVMRYGFINGANMLWENPAEAGKPNRADYWVNFGGDKAWIWPQADWKQRLGGDWPPPPAADRMTHGVAFGKNSVILLSPVLTGFGARIVREIELAPFGTQVTITTSVLQEAEDPDGRPVAAWSIAQVPSSARIYALLTPGSTLTEGWKNLGETTWKYIGRERTNEPEVLVAEPDLTKSGKIGIDARTLAVTQGNVFFLVRDVTPPTARGEYRAGERAQIYADDDDEGSRKAGIPAYTELEFTAPLKRLRPGVGAGSVSTVKIIWEMRSLPASFREPQMLKER